MWSGENSYYVSNGEEAIERLTASGAAAGFEYAVSGEHKAEIFERFMHILEKRNRKDGRIRIIHRFYAVTGMKL